MCQGINYQENCSVVVKIGTDGIRIIHIYCSGFAVSRYTSYDMINLIES
jgi:hypothetical protein